MARLIIVRGLPASGKSTYAKTLNCFHVEADMFFRKNGQYLYSVQKIYDAHGWCKRMIANALKEDMDVVVSNTFTQVWEMESYIKLGNKYKAKISVKKCVGQFDNTHNVPAEVLQKMKSRWENFAGEEIVQI